MTAAIIMPFRDRGVDPLRRQNMTRALQHWANSGYTVYVMDDGQSGRANFNRSAAYNRGAAYTNADILVFAEADILISYHQIRDAVALAAAELGLVVPYTRQVRLTETDSTLVRGHLKNAADCVPDHHPYSDGLNNTGCVNVISRETLAAVGQWDEVFAGHGHDDSAMELAFRICAGPTQFVDGSAYHLYHKDADIDTTHDASYLTTEDKQAQARNYQRMQQYRVCTTPEQIRQLTAGAHRVTNHWRTRI